LHIFQSLEELFLTKNFKEMNHAIAYNKISKNSAGIFEGEIKSTVGIAVCIKSGQQRAR
jgi:hypothetical protein